MEQDPGSRRDMVNALLAFFIIATLLYIGRPLVLAALLWWTS